MAMRRPSVVAIVVAAGAHDYVHAMHCSETMCGYRCTRNERRCRYSHDCEGVGAACAADCSFDAERNATTTVEWRTVADETRCRAARCATIATKGRPPLFERYATFADELLVVTPHKGASKYIKAMFARLYGCDLERQPGHNEIDFCGSPPTRPLTVAMVVRDPLDRAVAMYNHFLGNSGLENVCAHANATKGWRVPPTLARKEGGEVATRVARFKAWIDCVGPAVRDHGTFLDGIEFRHFQPATRYAYSAEADVVGRVEHLGALVDALAAKLPRLNATVDRQRRRGVTIDPWLDDETHRQKEDRGKYDRAHDLLPWGVHRCDLARSADARAIGDAVRATYATDFSCFGAVLPSWEQQRRRRLSDPARRLLGNHPSKLGCE